LENTQIKKPWHMTGSAPNHGQAPNRVDRRRARVRVIHTGPKKNILNLTGLPKRKEICLPLTNNTARGSAAQGSRTCVFPV
jgi:hypothetical protein